MLTITEPAAVAGPVPPIMLPSTVTSGYPASTTRRAAWRAAPPHVSGGDEPIVPQISCPVACAIWIVNNSQSLEQAVIWCLSE